MKDLKIMKCSLCGGIVLSIKECSCENCVTCCGKAMEEVSSVNEEKVSTHKPSYYRQDNKLIIRVNHEQGADHYIEAIIIKTDNELLVHRFTNEEEPELIMGYEQDMEIYSVCTKDGICKTIVE